MNQEPVLEMRHITKRFPGVTANDDVSLTLWPGEIHALLGENGAGKSTLLNILTGIYFPNEGEIIYKGKKQEISSPQAAVKLGIGMVHQHFKLVETLTAAENIALYSGKSAFFLDHEKMEREVSEIARRFKLDIKPASRIETLSIGERQRVEILKLLASGAELLVLDEPTAVLTPQESVTLFSSLREMANHGKTILVISHKLSEVMSFADRVSVLRGGRSVGERLVKETDLDELTEMMVGRRISLDAPEKKTAAGNVILTLKNVCAAGDNGAEVLRDISLELHRGEIFGIAGVSGNGQRELCEIMAGLRRITSGSLILNGAEKKHWSASSAVKEGISYIPDDRVGVGLAGHLNAADNLVLKNVDAPANSRGGIMRRRDIFRRAQKAVQDFDVRSAGIDHPVAEMSGGNIQKLIIAREVLMDPEVIIASYPTHGLDIGATDSVHRVLLSECEKGKAVLLISEDLDELFMLSDRIAVLYGGRIVGTRRTGETTIDEIGAMMLGNDRK